MIAKKPKTAPKVKAKKSASTSDYLDLCLILDCTASMGEWIERARTTLTDIIDHIKAENPALKARVCFVGYRDFGEPGDTDPRFCILDFSEDID